MTSQLTVKQAAQALNVSTRSIHLYIASGKIKATRIGFGKGVWRIPASEIEKMLAK